MGRLEPGRWLGKTVEVQVDRPMHSQHPEHGFTYGINYGFIPGTVAPDGEEIDAYVVGAQGPIKHCIGLVVAVIVRSNDSEDKLVVSVAGEWNERSVADAVRFQEQFFDSIVVGEVEI